MSEEVKEDVKEESSPSTEEVQEKVEDTTVESSPQKTTETAETPEQGKAQEDELDDRGVPWKNKALEYERKLAEVANEETIERIAQKVLEQSRSKPKEQEYTIAQLEKYAMENPEMRPWVEEEKAKIIQRNVARVTDDRIQALEKQKNMEVQKRASYEYVAKSYPQCFTKDAGGRMVWNVNSPMVKLMGELMSDKRLKDDAEGLMAAADIAYARVGRFLSSKNQEELLKKNTELSGNLKKVQKQTLVEGGGKAHVSNDTDADVDSFRRTGSKDALVRILTKRFSKE